MSFFSIIFCLFLSCVYAKTAVSFDKNVAFVQAKLALNSKDEIRIISYSSTNITSTTENEKLSPEINSLGFHKKGNNFLTPQKRICKALHFFENHKVVTECGVFHINDLHPELIKKYQELYSRVLIVKNKDDKTPQYFLDTVVSVFVDLSQLELNKKNTESNDISLNKNIFYQTKRNGIIHQKETHPVLLSKTEFQAGSFVYHIEKKQVYGPIMRSFGREKVEYISVDGAGILPISHVVKEVKESGSFKAGKKVLFNKKGSFSGFGNSDKEISFDDKTKLDWDVIANVFSDESNRFVLLESGKILKFNECLLEFDNALIFNGARKGDFITMKDVNISTSSHVIIARFDKWVILENMKIVALNELR